MVPTFTVVRLTGEVSGFTPAASSWLRRRPSPRPAGPDTFTVPTVPHPDGRLADDPHSGYAPHSSPHPPGSSWSTIKRLYDTGSSRTPSRLAHQTRPIRQCWTVLTLSRLLPPDPGVPQGPAAASFTPLLRQRGDAGLSPPSETTAPRGARRARPRRRQPHRRTLWDR